MGHWYVGQKVACIKRGLWSDQELLEQFPVFGQTLTIRAITLDRYGVCGLMFAEIINRPTWWEEGQYCEAGFAERHFRPVVERKTDIGFAHEILRRAQRERVDGETV